jgi:D-hexose-6-phosphate mutarotase
MQDAEDRIQFVDTPGAGLRRLDVATRLAEAQVYLHGAHVTRFQPRGQHPVLFVSKQSAFMPGHPIRGGVPICFPWFGARADEGPGPMHGFARLTEWQLAESRVDDEGTAHLSFQLAVDAAARALWPADAAVRYDVQIGSALRLALSVTNRSAEPIRFEEALHTYLAVSDVRQVSIEGLAGARYQDRLFPDQECTQGAEPIVIRAETDRIYAPTRATCIVHDPGWNRRLVVEKSGSDATVLWNPWIAKAKAMADFGDDEWPAMLCVETCNVRAHAVTLPPGQSHTLAAVIRVE